MQANRRRRHARVYFIDETAHTTMHGRIGEEEVESASPPRLDATWQVGRFGLRAVAAG